MDRSTQANCIWALIGPICDCSSATSTLAAAELTRQLQHRRSRDLHSEASSYAESELNPCGIDEQSHRNAGVHDPRLKFLIPASGNFTTAHTHRRRSSSNRRWANPSITIEGTKNE